MKDADIPSPSFFRRSLSGLDGTMRVYRINVIFRNSKGQDIKTVECNEGDDLLSLAHEHDVDLEGVCTPLAWSMG